MSIFGTAKPAIFPTTGINISSISYAAGLYTINTASAHGCLVGDIILLDGVSGTAQLNGLWKVYSIIDADSLTIVWDVIGTASGGTLRKGYQFKNSVFEFDFVESDQINHRSVITGAKTNTFLGDYGKFRIIERLWRGTTNFTAAQKFQKIYNFYHTNVWFLPHPNTASTPNKIIRDSSSNIVECYVREMKPYYWKNYLSYDAVNIELETNKYHDITKLLL